MTTLTPFPDTTEGQMAFDRLADEIGEALALAEHNHPETAGWHALRLAVPGVTAAVLYQLAVALPGVTEQQVEWLDEQSGSLHLDVTENLSGANSAPPDGRRVTCRVLTRRGHQCTGEAVDPNAELQICTRHLAEAMRLIQAAQQRTARG